MRLPSDVRKYLAENRVQMIRFNNGHFYSINEDIPELDKPAEPLIKDEKIRKAVRAWAEACGVNRVVNGEYDNELCAKGQQFYGAKIVLTKTVALPRGRNYTITELCGEDNDD